MTNGKRIGVGIVGTGGWAKYGHIAAQKTLDELEIMAIGSRAQATADAVAEKYGISNAFSDKQALIYHPDVVRVVVLTPALDHARLAEARDCCGKDVYNEWPLSTTTAESQDLLTLAEARGVRNIVGLQFRFGPCSRHLHDLVKQRYVGAMRSARMIVSVDAFGSAVAEAHAWSFDIANFAIPASDWRRMCAMCTAEKRDFFKALSRASISRKILVYIGPKSVYGQRYLLSVHEWDTGRSNLSPSTQAESFLRGLRLRC